MPKGMVQAVRRTAGESSPTAARVDVAAGAAAEAAGPCHVDLFILLGIPSFIFRRRNWAKSLPLH